MIESEQIKFADLIISMSTDFRVGDITWDTYRINLSSIAMILHPEKELEIRESTWLDAARDIELQKGSLKSIRNAWSGRFRGKAGKIREQINQLKKLPAHTS